MTLSIQTRSMQEVLQYLFVGNRVVINLDGIGKAISYCYDKHFIFCGKNLKLFITHTNKLNCNNLQKPTLTFPKKQFNSLFFAFEVM
jgi:hypothetical protein